jgi:hypothetical protein
MRLLCCLGLHRWQKTADSLGCYGMGLEWFENWECNHCPRLFNQLRGPAAGNPHQWRSPQYGWRAITAGERT